MPISARNRGAERGATLLETLIAVAILSLASGVAAGAIGAMSPRLIVDRAADQLIVDLKRARLAGETSGEPVAIVADAGGYGVRALDLQRRFRAGLSGKWNGADAARFEFTVGLSQQGALIELSKGKCAAIIEVAPISGRIERVR